MTSIEWTNETWNPVTGCTKVSAGCTHCYAEGIANRFWGDRKFTNVQFHPERLQQPLKWRKPRMVFVNSMSDLFHPSVTDEQLSQVLRVIQQTPQHTYQVLTKRPYRMRDVMRRVSGGDDGVVGIDKREVPDPLVLPNLWLGATVENQEAVRERVGELVATPSAIRFLSCEPLLEQLDFADDATVFVLEGLIGSGLWDSKKWGAWEDWNMLDAIDWVIVGGESGPRARVCDSDWIKSIVEQCKAAAVPVFVKQFGSSVWSKFATWITLTLPQKAFTTA